MSEYELIELSIDKERYEDWVSSNRSISDMLKEYGAITNDDLVHSLVVSIVSYDTDNDVMLVNAKIIADGALREVS